MDNLIRGILIEIDEIFENLEDMMSEEAAKDYQSKYNQLKLYFLDQQKLIEKQQKEIEALKQITQNYNAIGGETFGDDRIIVCSMKYFDDGYFKRNFIRKDKIKGKIKELQDNKPYLKASTTVVNNIEQIKMLQKLLGED